MLNHRRHRAARALAADPATPKTKVGRLAEPGQLARGALAHWPITCRPAGYYTSVKPVWVPTY